MQWKKIVNVLGEQWLLVMQGIFLGNSGNFTTKFRSLDTIQ